MASNKSCNLFVGAELGNTAIIRQPVAAGHKQVLPVSAHHVQRALQRINPCNAAGPYTVPGKRLSHTVLHGRKRLTQPIFILLIPRYSTHVSVMKDLFKGLWSSALKGGLGSKAEPQSPGSHSKSLTALTKKKALK